MTVVNCKEMKRIQDEMENKDSFIKRIKEEGRVEGVISELKNILKGINDDTFTSIGCNPECYEFSESTLKDYIEKRLKDLKKGGKE